MDDSTRGTDTATDSPWRGKNALRRTAPHLSYSARKGTYCIVVKYEMFGVVRKCGMLLSCNPVSDMVVESKYTLLPIHKYLSQSRESLHLTLLHSVSGQESSGPKNSPEVGNCKNKSPHDFLQKQQSLVERPSGVGALALPQLLGPPRELEPVAIDVGLHTFPELWATVRQEGLDDLDTLLPNNVADIVALVVGRLVACAAGLLGWRRFDHDCRLDFWEIIVLADYFGQLAHGNCNVFRGCISKRDLVELQHN